MKEIDSQGNNRALLTQRLVGKTFVHTLNGYNYKVVGMAWDGCRDEWVVVHVRAGSVAMFIRTVANFEGHHKSGRKRFTEVS